jgi:endonuclease III
VSAAATKNLKALLRKIGDVPPPAPPPSADPVAVLVMSFMLWESSTPKATVAFQRLLEQASDFNDLRVSMPAEIVEITGERGVLALERAQRLRAALRDVYAREHQVSLAHLPKQGKRDIRKYVETLDGVVPYVAARVQLLCFDTHAIPVDEQLRELLVEAGIAAPDATSADVSAWLARQVKANEAVGVHAQLQAWVDEAAAAGRRRKRPSQKKKVGSE